MHPKQMSFMALLFAAGTVISLSFAGLWLGSTEIGVANSVAVFKQTTILGSWAVTIPNITFFLNGAKAFMSFDFAFFGGVLAMVQWILILVFGSAFLWGFYSVMLWAVSNVFHLK